jgi:hypothetical protein
MESETLIPDSSIYRHKGTRVKYAINQIILILLEVSRPLDIETRGTKYKLN